MQELQDPPVGGLIELEVERPDLVGALGGEAFGRHSRLSQAQALPPALRDAQALLAPEALGALAIEAPPLLKEGGPTP